jgi:hypothetical protein
MLLSVFFLGAVVLAAGCGGCRQSRSWSRISGAPLELQLPSDFERPISFTTGREGEKDLFYESTDGKYKVKTYTDSGMWESEIEFVGGTK